MLVNIAGKLIDYSFGSHSICRIMPKRIHTRKSKDVVCRNTVNYNLTYVSHCQYCVTRSCYHIFRFCNDCNFYYRYYNFCYNWKVITSKYQ